jgi:hypothetical protein
MKRLLVVLTLIAFASPALGGCWAEIDPGAFADDCPIIIRGTIISVKEAAPGQQRADDIASIKVAAIVRNELKDVGLKVGDIFQVRMISRNNTQRVSTDLNYPVQTEALWLVVLNTNGDFRIDQHPVQKQPANSKVGPRVIAKGIETKKPDQKESPNPLGTLTKVQWITKQREKAERRARDIAEHNARQKEIRDIAHELAGAAKLEGDAVKRFQEASMDARRDVFQLRESEQPLTGDRLVEAVEFTLRNDPDENVRVFAANALGYRENWKRAGARAGVVLVQALSDRSASVRMFACQALGQRTEKEQAAAIAKLLRDDNADVRDMAVTTLGRLGILSVAEANAVVPILMESLVPTLENSVKRMKGGAKDQRYAELCQLLEKHTGQKLDTNPLAWLDWWEKARVDFNGAAVKVDRKAAESSFELYQRLQVASPGSK